MPKPSHFSSRTKRQLSAEKFKGTGRKNQWVNETRIAPWVIFVLKKAEKKTPR
jgi:hypothetical protein